MSDLTERAEAAKQKGLERAARSHGSAILQTQIALLRAILALGKATLDDATPPEQMANGFADNGKWRGAAVAELSRAGLIKPCGFSPTERPSRHCCWNRVWKANGKRAVRDYLKRIERLLLNGTDHGTQKAQ
jgi:hypothetical protein